MLEAYVQMRCKFLGCSKEQYLNMLSDVQINNTFMGIIIFGIISVVLLAALIGCIIILVSSKFKYSELRDYIPLILIFISIAFIGFIVGFGGSITTYMNYVENPDLAALDYLTNHIKITN